MAGRVFTRTLPRTYRAPTAGNADTIQTTPVSGVTLTLYRNVLQNGAGESVFVAQVKSAADGSYAFAAVPGGYYIVRNADEGARFPDGVSLVNANAVRVAVDVFVGVAQP